MCKDAQGARRTVGAAFFLQSLTLGAARLLGLSDVVTHVEESCFPLRPTILR